MRLGNGRVHSVFLNQLNKTLTNLTPFFVRESMRKENYGNNIIINKTYLAVLLLSS